MQIRILSMKKTHSATNIENKKGTMNSNAFHINYLDHDRSSTHLSLTTTLSVSTMDGSENLGAYKLTSEF